AVCSGYRARTRSRTSCRIAISSALSTNPPRPSGTPFVSCRDQRSEAAARGKVADHGSTDRFRRCHHVLQDSIGHVLLKDPDIEVCEQVHLVRLQLETQLVRHVAQHDPAEIRKPGFRTDAGELRHHDFDFVISELVRPALDLRQRRIDTAARMFIRVLTLHCKALASRSRNSPTSATTPTACPVPRSLTLVATAGLMSTHTIFTQLGSIFPVAIEC